MARTGIGLWELRSGRLKVQETLFLICILPFKKSTFSRARVGARVTAAALARAGRTLVMAESDQVYVWNLPHQAILSASPEPDVQQILVTRDQTRFLTASHKVTNSRVMESELFTDALQAAPQTQPSLLVVCRTLPQGEVVWTLEFTVRQFLPVVVTPDEHYVVGLAWEQGAR